jgi:hypothetical protein
MWVVRRLGKRVLAVGATLVPRDTSLGTLPELGMN